MLTTIKSWLRRAQGRGIEAKAVAGEPTFFRANENFFCPAMQSSYAEGLRYTVRPGNEKLAAQVQRWLGTGKIQLCEDATGRIHGRGQ